MCSQYNLQCKAAEAKRKPAAKERKEAETADEAVAAGTHSAQYMCSQFNLQCDAAAKVKKQAADEATEAQAAPKDSAEEGSTEEEGTSAKPKVEWRDADNALHTAKYMCDTYGLRCDAADKQAAEAAMEAQGGANVPPSCPKCGVAAPEFSRSGLAEPSCCRTGGAWEGTCPEVHSWEDGHAACSATESEETGVAPAETPAAEAAAEATPAETAADWAQKPAAVASATEALDWAQKQATEAATGATGAQGAPEETAAEALAAGTHPARYMCDQYGLQCDAAKYDAEVQRMQKTAEEEAAKQLAEAAARVAESAQRVAESEQAGAKQLAEAKRAGDEAGTASRLPDADALEKETAQRIQSLPGGTDWAQAAEEMQKETDRMQEAAA
jgi:hypothetical protein